MTQRIGLIGAAGRLGSVLAAGIAAADDLELVAAVSPSHAGRRSARWSVRCLRVARRRPGRRRGSLEALTAAQVDVALEVTGPATVGTAPPLAPRARHPRGRRCDRPRAEDLDAARRSRATDRRGPHRPELLDRCGAGRALRRRGRAPPAARGDRRAPPRPEGRCAVGHRDRDGRSDRACPR
jgi:hypothetical protein